MIGKTLFLPLLLFTQLAFGQSKTDSLIYNPLKCGLYINLQGDIGYRSEEVYNDEFDRRTRYITWIYGVDQNDSINGGIAEMKSVIDTSSFRFLNDLYWADKKHIYGFNPMSDGGTVYLFNQAHRRTFTVLGNAGYAKDKAHVYYRGMVINGADLKTFMPVNHKDIPELASDKDHFYMMGQQMTDEEIKEWKLDMNKNLFQN